MRLRIFSFAGALLFAAPAAATDLNAPLDARPTIQTELRRGWSAADQCDLTDEPLEYSVCIDRLSGSDASRGSSDGGLAFSLGLYLAAWQSLDDALRADISLPDNPIAQRQLPETRHASAEEFFILRDLQKKLGLTDDQVLQGAVVASTQIDGGVTLRDRWAFWLTQPYEEMAKAP